MFSRKNPVQKVTTKSKFYHTVFPYFSYAASSRQSETYQNIHGRFLANLVSIYLRERRQKKDCWKFPSQSLHKHLEHFSIKSLAKMSQYQRKMNSVFWSKMELIRPCSVVIGLIFYEKLKIVGNIHILFYLKKSRILVSSQVKLIQTQGTFKIMHPL